MSISTDQVAIPFEPAEGGIGQKFVTGTIKRLVPDEVATIFFTLEPSSPWVDQKPAIRAIKFNGGMGRTGSPILGPWIVFIFVASVLCYTLYVGLDYWARRDRQFSNNYMREAIQMGASAREEGISAEQLNTRVENFHQTLSVHRRPRKDTLIACAQAAFERVKQPPK
jgi:hypothetical protein